MGAGKKRLTKNALKHHGELRANLRLLMRRKNVDNTIDGGRGGNGVQGGKSQVAGFRDAQRGLDRFEIAHLANEHDVRVFAKRSPKRIGEGMRVSMYCAVIHKTLPVLGKKLD